MSEKEQTPELKPLTVEQLKKQIAMSAKVIAEKRATVDNLLSELEQQTGIMKYAQHLLDTFQLPNEVKAPPTEVK